MNGSVRDCSKCPLGEEKKVKDGSKIIIHCKVDDSEIEKERPLVFCGIIDENYQITRLGKICLMENNL